MAKNNGNKYRPSNGTEGDIFFKNFCDRCEKDMIPEGCNIQLRTMAIGTDEPEYPAEWVYDADGKPTCIEFTTKNI